MGITDYIKGGGFWGSLAGGNNPVGSLYNAGKDTLNGLTAEPDSVKQQRNWLNETASAANSFADYGQNGYANMSAEAAQQRAAMQRYANGQDSLSAEQLRQGLQSNMSQQRSAIASASPQNAPMAALMGQQSMGRSTAGMSGAAAIAGIAERQSAQKSLNDMILAQRGQDAQVALGSRGHAITGYGGAAPEKSKLEQITPALNAGAGLLSLAASDRRLKHEVDDGEKDVSKAIAGLKSYTYKYKDEKFGKGKRIGIMAQDLEKAGLKHAVVNTPEGKMVHGAHLSTANTAMIAELGKRLSKIEKGGK